MLIRFRKERKIKRRERQFLKGETGYRLTSSPVVIYDDTGMEPIASLISQDGIIELRGRSEMLAVFQALGRAVYRTIWFKRPPSHAAWLAEQIATAEPIQPAPILPKRSRPDP